MAISVEEVLNSAPVYDQMLKERVKKYEKEIDELLICRVNAGEDIYNGIKFVDFPDTDLILVKRVILELKTIYEQKGWFFSYSFFNYLQEEMEDFDLQNKINEAKLRKPQKENEDMEEDIVKFVICLTPNIF